MHGGATFPTAEAVGSDAPMARAPAAPRSRRRLHARLILAGGDAAALTAAVVVASAIRDGAWLADRAVHLVGVVVPFHAAMAIHQRAFAHDALERWQTGARRALTALVTAALVIIGIGFALKVSADYSRVVLIGGLGGAALLILGGRGVGSVAARRLLPHGALDVAVLVDGDVGAAPGDARPIDARRLGLIPTLDSPLMLDRIARLLDGSDRVVLCCPPERRGAWAAVLKGLGNEVQVMMPELDTLGVLGVGRFDGSATAVIARGPLRMADRVVKRVFDLAIVAIALPLALPILLAAAAVVRWEDGGPALFRQRRIGRGNRHFMVLKLRTMRPDRADDGGIVSTRGDDPRVTRVGRWLRRTSLDELPQLFNVLAGDMSIVGPRPHALGSTAEDALFWEVDRRYWLRHAVKPGLTGLAQVRGLRGATMRAADLTDRVQADLEYLVDWTLWRDVRIVVGTLRVLRHPRAF